MCGPCLLDVCCLRLLDACGPCLLDACDRRLLGVFVPTVIVPVAAVPLVFVVCAVVVPFTLLLVAPSVLYLCYLVSVSLCKLGICVFHQCWIFVHISFWI